MSDIAHVSENARFQELAKIVLEGFDPIVAHGFTQVPNVILKDKTISTNAKIAYAMLLSYAWYNDYVFPGQERLAEDMGTSRPTVTKAIGELVKAGFVEVVRRGRGLTNLYTLRQTVKQKAKVKADVHI